MPRPPNALVRAAICLGLIVAAAWTGLTACTDAGRVWPDQPHRDRLRNRCRASCHRTTPGWSIALRLPRDRGLHRHLPRCRRRRRVQLDCDPIHRQRLWGVDRLRPGPVPACAVLAFPASAGNTGITWCRCGSTWPPSNTVTLYNATAGSAFLDLGDRVAEGNNLRGVARVARCEHPHHRGQRRSPSTPSRVI